MSYRRVMEDIEHGKREPRQSVREVVGRVEETPTGYSDVFVSDRNGGTLYIDTRRQRIDFKV